MNKNGIIAVLVVLMLMVAGGILYYEAHTKSALPPTSILTPEASTTAPASSVSYVNNEYGFAFTLPASWQGYTIVTSTWTGYPTALHGPIISIRNPSWTQNVPTQDIPIMVFTLEEWSAVSSGTMSVSAAGVPPIELGRNTRYVFALPARYNYAFSQGWQEVQDIMQDNPLHAF